MGKALSGELSCMGAGPVGLKLVLLTFCHHALFQEESSLRELEQKSHATSENIPDKVL